MVGRPTAVSEKLLTKLMSAIVPAHVPSSAAGGWEASWRWGISACWRGMDRCWLGREGVPGSGNSGVCEGVMTTQGAPFSGSHKQSPENDAILKGLDFHLTIGSHLEDFKQDTEIFYQRSTVLSTIHDKCLRRG